MRQVPKEEEHEESVNPDIATTTTTIAAEQLDHPQEEQKAQAINGDQGNSGQESIAEFRPL